jgi:hypothetical protein
VRICRSSSVYASGTRSSGPCLIWERLTGPETVTLRLEGDLSLERARAIAESVR